MTPEQQAVVEKVQKLLALAGNNPNEHEAEAATQKAMDLLSAYNLTMHHVGKSQSTTTGKRDDKKRKGGLYGWQRSLWASVAKLNFCLYEAHKGLAAGSQYEHRLIGSEVNVISTEVMAEYLQQAIERRAQSWAKENGYKSVFVREAIAYREGMAKTICHRLEELREQRLREEREKQTAGGNGSGTEIVLADVIHAEEDYNNDYLYGYEPGTHARRRAERNAAQAKATAEYKAQMAEHDRKMAEDPEYAKAYNERAAKSEASWAEYRRQANAKAEARERRRMKNAGKPGYDDLGYKIQYRQMTAEEHRASLSSFGEGRRDGEKVSLHKQADHAAPKGRIK
jgi:hypothetical protein